MYANIQKLKILVKARIHLFGVSYTYFSLQEHIFFISLSGVTELLVFTNKKLFSRV